MTIPTEENDFSKADQDIAIYVLARNSGEGADRRNEPGDYQLHQEEKEFLTTLCSHYSHVIVVLNIGGVIDTSFFHELIQYFSCCSDGTGWQLRGRCTCRCFEWKSKSLWTSGSDLGKRI